jgi:hypothetical protein
VGWLEPISLPFFRWFGVGCTQCFSFLSVFLILETEQVLILILK